MVEIMGNCLPWLSSKSKRKRVCVLMVGLDNAGKTTAVNCVQRLPFEDSAPTVGFSSVEVKSGIFDVVIFDLGGGKKIRDIWKDYYAEVHGVIFMVDSSDLSRMDESKEIFENVLSDPLIQRKPVLLLANKQDKEEALEEFDVCENLNVQEIVNQNQCLCKVMTCAVLPKVRKGINQDMKSGFNWLLQTINQQYESLSERVNLDVKKREVLLEEQRKLRIERVRRVRDERAAKEAAKEREKEKSKEQSPSTPNELIPGQVPDAEKSSSLSVRSGLGDQLLDEEEEAEENSCTESHQRSLSRMSDIVRDSPTPKLPPSEEANESNCAESEADQTGTGSQVSVKNVKKKKRRKGNKVIPLSNEQFPLSSVVLPPIHGKHTPSSDSLVPARLPPLRPNIDPGEDVLV